MSSLPCPMLGRLLRDFQAIFRGLCPHCELDALTIEPGLIHGGNAALASIRGADGGELFRIYGEEDLVRLTCDAPACRMLQRAIARSFRVALASA